MKERIKFSFATFVIHFTIIVQIMKKQSQKLEWISLEDDSHLSKEESKLLVLAKASLENAHAPYSNFKVGAAAFLDNGKMLGGSNQENAAYPMCLCAERVALSAVASQEPKAIIKAMAITVKAPSQIIDQPAMPCGSCRQALCEIEYKQKSPIRLIIQGEVGVVFIFNSAKDILPFSFDASFL